MQSVSERLTEVEHDSDAITHELYKKINSTFVTPFDREDIYSLGSQLDDVMDTWRRSATCSTSTGSPSSRRCRANCTNWSTCWTSRRS